MSQEGVPVPLDALLAQREWVRALARRLVRDEDAADEIEQRTWLAAVERPPAELTSARGWLAAALRNAARKLGRGETRRARHEAASGARGPERPPEELVAEAEMQQLVGRLVLALDEPYRATVLMRFFEGLEPVEIARREGVPPETVRTRLHRAIAQLREKLDAEHDGGGGRPRGGRAAWSAALLLWTDGAPSTRAPRPAPRPAPAIPAGLGATAGGLVMTTAQKLVAAGILLLLLVGGGIAVRSATQSDARRDADRAAADAAVAASPNTAAAKAPRAARPAEDAPPAATADAPPPPPVDLDRCDRDLDLHGVVVLRDGRPVANADIRAVSFPWRRTSFLNHDAFDAATPGPSARSASDGSFSLRLTRGDVVTLRVSAAGLAPAEFPDQVAGGRVRLVLTPGVALRLVAVLADGTPAAGVLLEVRCRSDGLGVITRDVTTDAAGLATADGLPPGGTAAIRSLTAAAGSMYWWDVALPAEGGREQRLEFRPCRTLRGRVTDADTAAGVAGARVGMNWTQEHAVTTAADGSYELPGWTGVAIVGLAFSAEGYARAEATVGAQDVVDVALRRGFAVTGRVVAGPGAAPVPGALVGAIASVFADHKQTTSFGHTTTGEGGRFRITGLARDLPHVLVVVAPGRARARPDIPAPAPGADVDLGDVRLGASRAVEGRVVDADWKPVAGVQVTIDGPVAGVGAPDPAAANDYGREEDRTTDDLGRFRFVDLAPGAYDITASARGAPPIEQHVTLADDGDLTGVELRRPAASALVVHVVDESGKPLAGCSVDASTEDEQIGWVDAGAGGTAHFEVRAGIADLTISVFPGSGDGRALLAPDSVRVPAGAREVTVVVHEGVWVVGRVVDPDGRGVPRAEVVAIDAGHEPSAGFADGNGRFAVAAGKAGPYDVVFAGRANGKDTGLAARVEGVAAGADVVLRCERIAMDRKLRVRALTPDGAPVAGVHVFVTGSDGEPRAAVTGDDGVAGFEGLPAREHHVTSSGAKGLAPATALTVTPDGQTIDLRLRRARSLSGRVLDAAGKGAKARVAAWWSDEDVITAGTEDDGAFALPVPDDVAGPFRVVAEVVGADPPLTATAENVAPGTTGLELRLPAR